MAISRAVSLHLDDGESLIDMSANYIDGFSLDATRTVAGAPLQGQDFIDKVFARAQHAISIPVTYWADDNPMLSSGEGMIAVLGDSRFPKALAGRCRWPRTRFAAPADGVISSSGAILSDQPWAYGSAPEITGQPRGANTAVAAGVWAADDRLFVICTQYSAGTAVTCTVSDAANSPSTETVTVNRTGIFPVDNPGASRTGSNGGTLAFTNLTAGRQCSFWFVIGKEARLP